MSAARRLTRALSRPFLSPVSPRGVSGDAARSVAAGRSTAVIALGSNQGDRVEIFREALRRLAAAGLTVTRHSSLYETAPAYVTDQPAFLNAAAVVRAEDPALASDPLALLDALKTIERDLGRVEGGLRFGPRPIDLDVIFHERGAHACERLEVPHPRFAERGFVLAPLADLHAGVGAPAIDHPAVAAGLDAARSLWRASGGESRVGTPEMRRVMPLGDDLVTWGDRAKLMGVLNVTPDSFSDGGALRVARVDGLDGDLDGDLDRAPHRVDLARVVHAARRLVDAGAEFIDVGGQSTRPGATLVSAEEETARTIPAIAALTGAFAGEPADRRPRVSVDTFYGSVAAAAVAAGADVINDVSAGTMDPGMFAAVAATPATRAVVAMHMRGDPGSMQSERHTTYAGGDVAGVAGEELAAHVAAATRAGVEPWRLWTDPGLGFAKTHEGCWDLLENLPGMRASMARRGAGGAAGAPMLVGASRKGFLGAATGRERAADRDAATAAACVAAGLGGADVLRVHDVAAVRDAVKVADAVVDAARRRRRRNGTADAHPWEERGA